MGEKLESQAGRNLVRNVRDTDVEERKGNLHAVALDHLKLILLGGGLHALYHLADHALVVLDSHYTLHSLEDGNRHVSGSRTNLENNVGRLQASLLDNGSNDGRVLKEMLTDRSVGGD